MSKYNLSNDDNYKTPDYIFNPLNEEFNFDYDPCPYFEGEINDQNDGLLKEWGKSNFVNPPYSRGNKDLFVLKAIEESKKGKVCVLLIPTVTSTKLFHDHIKPNAKEIRFVRNRIKFEKLINNEWVTPKSGGRHDSMIIVFDINPELL